MLTLSLVEQPAFKEWLRIIDPSFSIPDRYKLRETLIPGLLKEVRLKKIQFIF